MYKVKSLQENLSNIFNIKKAQSFDNFNNLLLKGNLKFISYGDYLLQNKNATKIERQRALKNHFYNYRTKY